MQLQSLFPTTSTLLKTIGAVFTTYRAATLLHFLYLHLLHRSTLFTYLLRLNTSPASPAAPTWALVTGASDGIGRGFAEELLSRGFNVILHGRNASKLAGVKKELSVHWPDRAIRICVLDAQDAARDHAAIQSITQPWVDERLNLRVLINNVGGAGGVPKAWVALRDRTGGEIDTFIDVNAGFPSQITRAVLPLLFASKPSLIVNVGSVTAGLPSPYLSVYAGTKAYIRAWSRSLRAEMAAEGLRDSIEVLQIDVGQVRASHDRGAPSFFAPSGRTMAKASLNCVGCGRGEVASYWPHAVQIAAMGAAPEWLREWMMVNIAKRMKGEEERAK